MNVPTLLVIDAVIAGFVSLLWAKVPGTKHRRANTATKHDLRITSLIFIPLLVNLSQGENWGSPTQYRRHSFLLNLIGVKTDNFCSTVANRCDCWLTVIVTMTCGCQRRRMRWGLKKFKLRNVQFVTNLPTRNRGVVEVS